MTTALMYAARPNSGSRSEMGDIADPVWSHGSTGGYANGWTSGLLPEPSDLGNNGSSAGMTSDYRDGGAMGR